MSLPDDSIASIPASVAWIEALLTGTLALSISVIAIALIGLAMLFGRLPPRAAMQSILGCFIVFGAPSLARGLMDFLRGHDSDASADTLSAPPAPPALPSPPPFDPNAGAAVPRH